VQCSSCDSTTVESGFSLQQAGSKRDYYQYLKQHVLKVALVSVALPASHDYFLFYSFFSYFLSFSNAKHHNHKISQELKREAGLVIMGCETVLPA
jgi:hypothetical protein